MIPWEFLDSARVPGDGGELRLYKRGREFSIRIDGRELMNSSVHGSEEALAELAAYGLDPYGLLLAGQVVCDLGMPINASTLLNLNLENGHEWFRLSHQHHF